MNKILNSITVFILLLVNGIKRFYINTFFTVIIFGIIFYLINWKNVSKYDEKILERIIFVAILGFLISTLFTLVVEKITHYSTKLIIINVITSIALPILYFFFILTDIANKYQVTTLAGIVIALVFISIYFANKTDNENFTIHFSYLIKTLFVAAIITTIIMLGLFLCTAAVHYLIYKFSDVAKIYATIASFCWIALFVNLFLSYLPKKADDYKTPKFFKILTLYTALPVYLGLIVILYVYLGKIIVTQKFPSGQLNWFASYASIIGIFLFLSLKQYFDENEIVKWYVKLFGYILLPIITMQCIAYGIRFSNYGLTSARYISIVLIGVSIVTAVVSLIRRGKHVPYVLFLLALCSLITTTGYFNLYDAPVREQESRLTRVLKDNSMIDNNNKIIAKADADTQTKIKITSSYNYMVRVGYKNITLLKDNSAESLTFKQLFGFEQEYAINNNNPNNQYIAKNTYVNYGSIGQGINISGYNNLIEINNSKKNAIKSLNNNVLVINNDKEYTFDLNTLVNNLFIKYGVTNMLPQGELELEEGNGKLVITNISFFVDNDNQKININNIEGYILEK